MRSSTLSRLRCPACAGNLTHPESHLSEIASGILRCARCGGGYPILAGVAVLVEDVQDYLMTHASGISRLVPQEQIPAPYRDEFREVVSEIETGEIESDLESQRVVSLYLANHYLSAGQSVEREWWKLADGSFSAPIDSLIRAHWDSGPQARIENWVTSLAQKQPLQDVIELGCGVGGLGRRLSPHVRSYLGVDSSFASVALGRHLALGAPYADPLAIPSDLLDGPVARAVRIEPAGKLEGSVDFIVADIEAAPVAREEFDVALALNLIDMLPEPGRLPELQFELLRGGGTAIQSSPYIWHEVVASELRSTLPDGIRGSARAVEWLYQNAGFRIEETVEHLPWLFYKHARQLEVYSVHAIRALKPTPATS